MKKLSFNSNIFKKYLLSYMIIIILTFCVTICWCAAVYNKYKTENLKNNALELETFADSTDEIMKNLYYSIENLKNSDEFYKATVWQDENSIRLLKNKLSSCIYPFTSAENIIVYLSGAEKYIGSGIYNKHEFYGLWFLYGDMDEKTWKKEAIESTDTIKFLPASDVVYGIKNKKMLGVVFSANRAKIVLLLDMGKVNKNGQLFSITENSGKVVYSNFPDTSILSEISGLSDKTVQKFLDINNRNYLISYCQSKFTPINYCILTEKREVLQSSYIFRNTAIITFIINILVEIVLAVYLSAINVSPIYNLFNRIKDSMLPENGDEISLNSIGNGILRLIENNNNLSMQLEKRLEDMKENFLYRVLTGGFTTSEQAEKYMRSMNIAIDDESFFVFLMEIKEMSERAATEIDIMECSAIKTFIFNKLKHLSGKVMPVDTNDNKIAVVCGADLNRQAEFYEHVQRIVREIKSSFGFVMYVSVGGAYDGIMGIFYSHSEAVSVMNYMKLSGKTGIVKYSETDSKNILYYYPIDIEERLINLVTSGETAETKKVFGILCKENTKERELSPLAFDYLKNAIVSTFMRIAEIIFKENSQIEKNVDMLINEVKGENNAKDFFDRTSALYMQLCDVVSMSNEGKNQKLKNKIENYLNENYQDPNLSLYMISKEFNLSESYFSRNFKELFGSNFSSWVENARVSEAMKLIDTTNLKINEIAQKVGYNNTQVLRRAFKRVSGISPDGYRKKHE